MKPISGYVHYWVIRELQKFNVNTIVDIGGTGKLNKQFEKVTNANIKNGIDGTNLPYKDNQFDASVSIATLEHVSNQKKFLEEAIRIARIVSIHWFPYGKDGKKLEKFKKSLGHNHPSTTITENLLMESLDSKNLKYSIIPSVTYREHMLLLATMYPKLNIEKLYDFLYNNGDRYYGIFLIIEVKS